MIKMILFDLDGVLVEAKQLHFDAFNEALEVYGDQFVISEEDHLNKFDGLPTKEKLKILTKERGFPTHQYDDVYKRKQAITLAKLRELPRNEKLINLLTELKKNDYKLACCSNSIRKSLLTALEATNIIQFFDIVLSNEDVSRNKPHADIYWLAMSMAGCDPEECIIVEDSPVGLRAAHRTGAHVLRVDDPDDLLNIDIFGYIFILDRNERIEGPKIPVWDSVDATILIPMAGEGSRFAKEGYLFPKPLIAANHGAEKSKTMIQKVIESLKISGEYVFLVKTEHYHQYNLGTVLRSYVPDYSDVYVVEVTQPTEGAACTSLLARNMIDNERPLLIVNSDQHIVWDSNKFMYKMINSNVDAAILTFPADDPKWSYVKLNDEGYVSEVAEKKVISNKATCGIYFWKRGSDYVKYAEQMIQNGTRVNGEFYICPVFNEAIKDGKRVVAYDVDEMNGLGTPIDLENFRSKV